MTVTPRGVSTSLGVNGARVSANSRGQVTRTVGIPGSGISHTTTVKRRATQRAAAVPPAAKAPGLTAPKWQKELFKAVRAGNTSAYAEIGTKYPEARIVAVTLDGFSEVANGNRERATALLQWAWDYGGNVETEWFVGYYLSSSTIGVPVADGVFAELPISRDAVGLLLVELLQDAGRRDEAIAVAEALDPSAVAAVSLAELYVEQQRYDDVIELTNGIENTDDATALLATFRGVALNGLGHHTAAREALKSALRSTKRKPEILHLALLERARAYVGEGKNAMAKKDLERILAANSDFPGIREAIAELG